jgi:hypothetical protein
MTSPFALLFLAIQQRLDEIMITRPGQEAEEKALRYIDAELGQLENYFEGGRPSVSMPCALIDVDNATFKELGQNSQDGVITVVIRLGFDPYSSSSNLTPAESRNKALFYYELEQAVYNALHGWTPESCQITPLIPAAPPIDEVPAVNADFEDTFGHLIRVGARTEERRDQLRVRTIAFTLSIEDKSARPGGTTFVAVTPNITASFPQP